VTTYKYQFISATLGCKCHHDQIKVLNATIAGGPKLDKKKLGPKSILQTLQCA